MPPQLPQNAGQIDPSVVKVMSALKKIESGGDYNAVGDLDKGVSKGAYQFNRNNWSDWAKQYLGDAAAPMTPANQNKLMYTRIKQQKDQGLQPEEIAAIHNGARKDAGGKFTYINPVYGEKFRNALGTVGAKTDPSRPIVAPPIKTELEETKDKNVLSKIVDFMFPILEKKERTPLQTVGDLGLSALWFVPGLGGAASTALRGAGLAAKTASTVSKVAEGAALGYGTDVGTKLSEGKGVGESLTPGAGTLVGGATGGLVSRVTGKYSERGVVDSISKENNAVFGQTKSGARKLEDSFSRNKDPGKLAAEKGINLKQMVDPETVAYNTTEKRNELIKDASTLNETLTDALARTEGAKAVSDIKMSLLSKVSKAHPERADIVRREMDLLRKQYGDTPTIADLNEWKQRNWNLGKFDMAVPNDTRLTHRMIGNQLKTDVEALAKIGGLDAVGEMNEYIGSHLDLADMIEKLHGTKAKGGRLGNMMRESALTTIGGVSGMFGAGPVGMLMGVLAGHYGSAAITKLLRKIEGSPIKSAILNRIMREDPEVVKKVMEYANKTPGGMQKLKDQLEKEGIDIFPEQDTSRQVSPLLTPQEGSGGLIPGLMTRTMSRAAAQ